MPSIRQSPRCAVPRWCDILLMKTNTELARMAWSLVDECQIGLLITADREGWPHATWMNFGTKGYLDEIFTISAPTTQKVANLRVNPRTEWMFARPGFKAEGTVYVTGETRIIEGDAVQPWWDAIPGKLRAFTRNFDASGDFHKFVALVTKVTGVVSACPLAYRKTTVFPAPPTG